MPCIQTKVNVPIPTDQKEAIKTAFGKAIRLIPGKSENWLMLTFEDNCSIYFQGNGEIPAAFVEIKIYGKANGDACQKMTAAVTNILHRELNIDPARIYVKYEETSYWGWNGSNF